MSDYDVTGLVNVADPEAVCAAIKHIFKRRYPRLTLRRLDTLFADFAQLYRGERPGFHACETGYHDMRHVLDVTLAMARLLDGYDAAQSRGQQLGAELAFVGVSVALYHDAGYIRRRGDSRHQHGAEYTRTHVSRSARYLRDYLNGLGLPEQAELAARLVHYTGYETRPDQIPLDDPRHRVLGALIGTADVVAQMADPAYLEKCRDQLYPEFVLGGMTHQRDAQGRQRVIYGSELELLEKTPAFIQNTIDNRLDALFGSLYRYLEVHFGGPDPYMTALRRNCRYLEQRLAKGPREQLLRGPLRAS